MLVKGSVDWVFGLAQGLENVIRAWFSHEIHDSFFDGTFLFLRLFFFNGDRDILIRYSSRLRCVLPRLCRGEYFLNQLWFFVNEDLTFEHRLVGVMMTTCFLAFLGSILWLVEKVCFVVIVIVSLLTLSSCLHFLASITHHLSIRVINF